MLVDEFRQANHEGSGRPIVLDHLGRHDAPIVIADQDHGSDREVGT
jgi:hypothetical protein